MANAAVKRRAPVGAAPKKRSRSKYAKYLASGGFDIPFLLLTMAILSIGLVMLFSSSYTYAYYNNDGDSAYYFKRQFIFAVLGVIAMLVVSKVRYDFFKIAAIPLLGVSWLLLVAVLVLPAKFGDFHRWIVIGPISFQPSEIAKLAVILYCAWGMERNRTRIIGKTPNKSSFALWVEKFTNGKFVVYDSFVQLCSFGLIIVITAGLVYLENHVSGTLLILGIGIIMLYLGEFKKHWFIILAVIAAVGIAFVILNPGILEKYAGARITAWLDKDYDPRGARWQTNNSLYAIGSGGLFGVGLGNSKQKHLYVSEPQNDFIFSIVCEELGVIGASVIIILFALLVWRGIVIGIHAKDRFGALLAMGIVFQVGVQTALNIGVVTDTLPNTGISLPFFSYGGTSLMMLLFEMGMVLSVSRYSRLTKK